MTSSYAKELASNDVWNLDFDEEIIKPFLDYRYVDKFINHDTMQLEKQEQSVQFICIFRNDQKMEKLPKKFLTFIKKYAME